MSMEYISPTTNIRHAVQHTQRPPSRGGVEWGLRNSFISNQLISSLSPWTNTQHSKTHEMLILNWFRWRKGQTAKMTAEHQRSTTHNRLGYGDRWQCRGSIEWQHSGTKSRRPARSTYARSTPAILPKVNSTLRLLGGVDRMSNRTYGRSESLSYMYNIILIYFNDVSVAMTMGFAERDLKATILPYNNTIIIMYFIYDRLRWFTHSGTLKCACAISKLCRQNRSLRNASFYAYNGRFSQ